MQVNFLYLYHAFFSMFVRIYREELSLHAATKIVNPVQTEKSNAGS